MTQTTRKHHYIPIFYLKPWATQPRGADRNCLIEYSRPYRELKERTLHPAETGFEIDLYSGNTLPQQMNDWLEREVMKSVDDQASVIRNSLLSGEITKKIENRQAWSRFLISLVQRNPERIKSFKRIYKEQSSVLERHMRVYYEARFKGYSDYYPVDFYRQYQEFRRKVDEAHDENFNDMIVNFLNGHMTKGAIEAMVWHVMECSTFSLLTSDRPLHGTNGIGYPWSYLCLAISPSKMFIAANNVQTIKNIEKNKTEFTKSYNRAIISKSRKFVYASNKLDRDFIAKWFGQSTPHNLWLHDDARELRVEQDLSHYFRRARKAMPHLFNDTPLKF